MSLIPFPMPKFLPLNLASKVTRGIGEANAYVSGLVGNIFGPGTYINNFTNFSMPDALLDSTFTTRSMTPKDFSFIRVLDSNYEELDVIEFQFMPKSIADVKQALYQDIAIIGRSSPFKSYSSSSPRGISFSLEFFASPEQGTADPTPEKIKDIINRLQALVHPIYNNYNVYPPPKCLVHIGDQIEMIGVCRSVSCNYNERTPWTSTRQGNGKIFSFGVTVQLAFDEIQQIPLGYNERKAGFDIMFVPERIPEGIVTVEATTKLQPIPISFDSSTITLTKIPTNTEKL